MIDSIIDKVSKIEIMTTDFTKYNVFSYSCMHVLQNNYDECLRLLVSSLKLKSGFIFPPIFFFFFFFFLRKNLNLLRSRHSKFYVTKSFERTCISYFRRRLPNTFKIRAFLFGSYGLHVFITLPYRII